jgi:hypothetical protein
VAATAFAATVPLVGGSAEAALTSTTSESYLPAADVTVSSAHNYRTYGTSGSLQADSSPIVRSYLKFVISDTARSVQRATLRLRSMTTSTAGVTVSKVIGNDWTESMVFANAYAIGAPVATSGPVTKGLYVDIDLTPAVTGAGTYSFVLTSPSNAALSFPSRESRTPPRLTVVATSVVPEVVVPVVSATPVLPSTSPTVAPTPAPTVAPLPSTSPTTAPVPTTAPTTAAGRALHIHHGFDLATPSQIAAHAALIDSRPIDGVTVNLPTLSNDTLYGVAHSQAEYASALSAMPRLQRVTHNFVVVRTMHPIAWYDDASWSTITQNLAHLAAAAAAKGQFDGIFVDVEYYGSGTYPWNFGTGTAPWTFSSTGGAVPGHSASDANATVSSRGRQAGDAIAAAWPSAAVLTTYGPWVGETKTGSAGGWGGFGYNDTAWTNELMGSFTGGLADAAAAHPTMTYVDGGEVYQAHTPTEYATAYAWMKTGLASSGSVVVRDPSTYASAVSAGFGVYDKDMRVTNWPTMGATQWQGVLKNALSTADRYVWSYSEAYDWLGTGWPTTPVPADILTATANAMAAAT